jgi:hypothetical protein
MESFIRYLIFRYGDAVLGWTIKQVVDRLTADGVQATDECPSDVCVTVRHLQRKGYDLDPDCGVYFWELPTREQ